MGIPCTQKLQLYGSLRVSHKSMKSYWRLPLHHIGNCSNFTKFIVTKLDKQQTTSLQDLGISFNN